MRQLQVVLTIIWLVSCVGCGSSNQSAPTLNEMQAAVQTAADEEMTGNQEVAKGVTKVCERMLGSRATEDTSVTFKDVPMDGQSYYLAVAEYDDGSVKPLTGFSNNGNEITVEIGDLGKTDTTAKQIAVYQFGRVEETKIELLAKRESSTKSSNEDRILVILHGQGCNTSHMAEIAKTIGETGYFSAIYNVPYDSTVPIQNSAKRLWQVLRSGPYGNLTGYKRIVIIAHSQGGIEARYLIEKMGMSHDVESLIMLGTPNNGAAFAGSITANKLDLLSLIGLASGNPFAVVPAFTVEATMVADLPLRQLSEGSAFLKELNESSKTDVNYITVAGDVGNGSDGLVKYPSVHYFMLEDEARWTAHFPNLPIDHTELRYDQRSMEAIKSQLKRIYGEPHTQTSMTYFSFGNNEVNAANPQPSSPTTTTTQVTLAHPASRWDYGENGFWYREGKWHAAAKRVDVGAPIEPVQMDGRDGRIKSGVSQRGFCYQRCQNGLLVNLGTDVVGIKGEFYNHYREAGGPQGELGCITTEQQYDQRSGVSGRGGEWAQFEGGFITKFDGFTAKVLGDFARVWNDKGKGQGELGYPKDQRRAVKSGAPQFVNTDGGWGQYQPFEGGCIAEWSQTEHVITGGFNREYLRTGGPGGPLGYPQTAKRTGVRSGCSARQGEEQIFQFGRICELGVNNAWAVYGEILKRYGPEYGHGFPLGPSENDNHRQRFEGTVINWWYLKGAPSGTPGFFN